MDGLIYSLAKSADGLWETRNMRTKKVEGAYSRKSEAVAEAMGIVKKGATVVIHAVNGDVQEVVGVRDTVRKAPVKRRMSNKSVNIAIAKVLEKS
jgi:hypothetical protein